MRQFAHWAIYLSFLIYFIRISYLFLANKMDFSKIQSDFLVRTKNSILHKKAITAFIISIVLQLIHSVTFGISIWLRFSAYQKHETSTDLCLLYSLALNHALFLAQLAFSFLSHSLEIPFHLFVCFFPISPKPSRL